MNKTFKYLAVSGLSLLIAAAFSTANATPTQAQVNKAREECHAHKLQVLARGSFARDKDREAWEAACGHANTLMSELHGESADTAAFETGPATKAD